MLYLYLDESGDPGFDFFAKKPSKIAVLECLGMKGKIEKARVFNETG